MRAMDRPPASRPAPPPHPAAADPAWLRHQHRLDVLGQLAELEMSLAAAIRRQAEVGHWPSRDEGALRERLARSARRCLALSARLDAAFQAEASGTPRRAAPMPRAARRRLKDRIANCVAAALAVQVERSDLPRLVLELRKRIKDAELDDDLADLPIGEIMASLCREFGVKADMSGLTRAELGLGKDAMRRPATPRQ